MSDTLSDLKSRHDDNFEYLRKTFKTIEFKSANAARNARLDFLDRCLDRLGVKYLGTMDLAATDAQAHQMLEDQFERHNTRVEHWDFENRPDVIPGDLGFRVYHNNEIIYFISLIYENPVSGKYEITTNAINGIN